MFPRSIKICAAILAIAFVAYAGWRYTNVLEGEQILAEQAKAEGSAMSVFIRTLANSWSIEVLKELLGDDVVLEDLTRYTRLIENGAKLGRFKGCKRYGVSSRAGSVASGADWFTKIDCQFEHGDARIEYGVHYETSPVDIIHFYLKPK